jgi:predicted RNase H-like nuclease
MTEKSMPDEVVVAELRAALQAALNGSRELLSLAKRLLAQLEGGIPVAPAEAAVYWEALEERDRYHARTQQLLDQWALLRPGPEGVQ